MHVVQVSTYDGGQGAARAAFRLHRALRDQGIDSSMRVAHACSGDAWVQAPSARQAGVVAKRRQLVAQQTAAQHASHPFGGVSALRARP